MSTRRSPAQRSPAVPRNTAGRPAIRPRPMYTYSPAAERAGRMLCRKGLAGVTLPDGRGFLMFEPQGWAWLEELRIYIGSNDPLMIGAAAILEAEGHERTQPTLFDSNDLAGCPANTRQQDEPHFRHDLRR